MFWFFLIGVNDQMKGDEEIEGLGVWWREVPSLEGEVVGVFGYPESAGQLRKAEDLLRDQGCTLMVGPMEGNTWKSHRVVVESDGRPSFLLEPTRTFDFGELGYEVLARYSSSLIDLSGPSLDLSRIEIRLERERVQIRPLELTKIEGDLRAIYELSLRAFQDNFLYTPIDEDEFLGMYQKMLPLLSSECAFLAERDGELVGFVFGYPERDCFVVKTVAVLPERRLAGLGTVLVQKIQESAERAGRAGFRQAIHALQREDNQSLRISDRFDARVFRRYALYSKEL